MKTAAITAIPVCIAVACAAALAGGHAAATGAGPSPVKKGRALYNSLSCSACHTLDGSGGAGPTFKHLYRSKVKLSTGKTVIADDAYLIRSIRDPDAQIVKGRPSGEEKCENCRYYLENTADISYCWHPKLRILVGAEWWCQWWEAIPEGG